MRINTPESNFIAFILFIIAFLTDFLDGFLARALKSVSRIGQIIDPMSDKILTVTVSALLYFSHKTGIYFFLLILLRDLVISMGAIYAMNSRKKMIVQPQLTGKITTMVLGLVLALYLLRDSFIPNKFGFGNELGLVVKYGTWFASLMLVLSGLNYAVYYYRGFLTDKAASK
jgi:CDP-diacylglycerol--glycerol-3-phosphate 3-phosphatidyltransferase